MKKQSDDDDGSFTENDLQEIARKAAVAIQEEFDRHSTLRNSSREMAVPIFDPKEIMLREIRETLSTGRFCSVARLRGISIRYDREEPFDQELEDHRDHFADRSHEEHFVVKAASYKSITTNTQMAARAAASIMLETKILANQAKHPHICQLYGTNASGVTANFGCKQIENGFFIITDMISETLPERMQSWRAKKGYEGDRFDSLESRQSQLTQRLEVVLDICSAMLFLAGRSLIYHLHPKKIGFDSRYARIKLFDFSEAREMASLPLQQHHASSILLETEDMWRKVYLAPEVLLDETVTVSSDVYAIGMLIWEILTLRHPFEGMPAEMYTKTVVEGRTKPPMNKTWPEVLRTLMGRCWSAAEERPVMKDVFDGLENSLLFQDLGGIDRTEDHAATSSRRPRRISYKRAGEATIPEEERDKDTKSVRSQKSHESRKSNGSEGSGKHRPPSNRRSGTRRSASSPSLNPEPEQDAKDGDRPRTRASQSNEGKVHRHKSVRNIKDEPTSPEKVDCETAARKSRKIVYKPNSPATKEERDRDAKSTRSQKSQRSHETEASGRSKTSRSDSSRKITRRKSDPRLGGERATSSSRTSHRPIGKNSGESDSQEKETDGNGRSKSSQGGSENDRNGNSRNSESVSPRGEKTRRPSGSDAGNRRKIVYKPDQPMTEEERDRDAKSTKSHKSQKSHGSNEGRPESTHADGTRRSTAQRSSSSRRISRSPVRQQSSRELRKERTSRHRSSRHSSLQTGEDPSNDNYRKERDGRERRPSFKDESQGRSNSSSDQSTFLHDNNSSFASNNIEVDMDDNMNLTSPKKTISGELDNQTSNTPRRRSQTKFPEPTKEEDGKGRGSTSATGRAAPSSRQVSRIRSSDRERPVPSRQLGERSKSVAGLNHPPRETNVRDPSRGISRRRSGDVVSHAVREPPSARRIGRHKSNDVEQFRNTRVTSAREAPSSRRVPRSKSFDGYSPKLGAGNSRGEERPHSEKRVSRPSSSMAGRKSLSTRDFGIVAKQKEAVVERMSLSMSDHSKWIEFNGKDDRGDDENGQEDNNYNPNNDRLKPSSKDNQRSNRNRIVKEAKESKMVEQADAQSKRKEAYSKAVQAATQEGGRGSKKNPQRRPSYRKPRKSLGSNDPSAKLMKLAAEALAVEQDTKG